MNRSDHHGRDQRAHSDTLSDSAWPDALGVPVDTFDAWVEAGLVRGGEMPGELLVEDAATLRSLCTGRLRATLDRLRQTSTGPFRRLLICRDAMVVREFAGPLGRIGRSNAGHWHASGVDAERRHDFTTAIDRYERALFLGGSDTQIVFDLAFALARSGRYERAAERYRQVIELDPTRQDAWVNLGDAYLSTGRTDAAIDALHRALDLDPDDPAAHYNLADAFDTAGHPATAVLHYRAFVRLERQSTPQSRYARHRVEQFLHPVV